MPFEPVVPAAPSPEQVRAALRGTYIAFVGSGFAFASWASRIPQIRAHLHLSPERLGLVLLFVAAGSVTALPLAGPVVHRLGAQRALKAMAALLTVGLGTVAVGYLVGATPVVVGLFLFGFANGAWDVAMNVQGALVERHVGRSIMARFHAGSGNLRLGRQAVTRHELGTPTSTEVAMIGDGGHADDLIPDDEPDGVPDRARLRSAMTRRQMETT